MKSLLPALLLVALSATSYAAVKVASGHYLLLHPSATIETDFGGRCERIHNVSDGIIYLPVVAAEDFNTALRSLRDQLHVDECKTQ